MERSHITQETADEFALGALDEPLRSEIAGHLEECLACSELANDSLQLAASLAMTAPLRMPSPELLDRVYADAGIGPRNWQKRLSRRATAAGAIAAGVVAVAALTGVIWVRGQVDDLRRDNAQTRAQLADVQSQKVEIAALTRSVADGERTQSDLQLSAAADRELLLAMLSPDSVQADVFSVDDGGSAIGRLVWDDQQKRLLFVANKLPARPVGETYQIWVDSGGRYVSLGTFNSDATGFARYATNLPGGLKGYQSALVTVERAGGAFERSGPSVFVMDLSRIKR